VSRQRRLNLITTAAIVVAVAAIGQFAAACELCRQMGTAAYHVAGLGSDDANDAMDPPPDDSGHDDGTAHPSFVVSGSRWPVNGPGPSDVTLTYSYENLLDGGLKMPSGQPLPVSLIRKSVETALGLWAGVVPIHFIEVPDDGKPYGQSTKYGDIRLRHIYINGPDIPGQQPMAKAQAYFPPGGFYAGDVEFDHGDPWQEFGTLSVPDILGATTHEIGHSLGLHHTDIPEANMYWIFRRTQGLSDGWLHPDDIAGMQFVYGAGIGSVTPLPIPEPATWLIALTIISTVLLAHRRRAFAGAWGRG
jgi:hypothetical protein